jgi:hypothetical protein
MPREQLAELAAARVCGGLTPGPVLSRLRLLTTAELLCPAARPRYSLSLEKELTVLCDAVEQLIRRRPGWLHADIACGDFAVAVRRRLLYAALLSSWRSALQTGGTPSLDCMRLNGSVLLRLCGSGDLLRGDSAALLRCLAAEAGGAVLFTAAGEGQAVLRLPPAELLPQLPCRGAVPLVEDRFSLPHLYLAGWCAGENDL